MTSLAIVGSRAFPDLERVRAIVRELPADTLVISGGASWVDRVAVDEARWCGLAVTAYPADWQRYGRRAGAVRNQQMVESADEVAAFWDGASSGTLVTIRALEETAPVEAQGPWRTESGDGLAKYR